jgi:hypothetical protein
MPTIDIQIQRFSVVSQRSFDEVIRRLTAAIGRPDLKGLTMRWRRRRRWASSKQLCDRRSDHRI